MTRDILSQIESLAAAHASPDQPTATFETMDRALAQVFGHKLFTVLMYDEAVTESIRVYANLVGDYPLGGRKKIVSAQWKDRLFHDGLPFVGHTAEDLKLVFSDHELIRSLGCESVLNIPVRWNGETIATANLLHTAGWYANVDLAVATVFAQLLAPAIMSLRATVR
ncbi:MAG: GAF domain-containing protein [Janthinobacterium lividum]